MESPTLVCFICSLPSPLCYTHLEIPICEGCWNESIPFKNPISRNANIDKITPKVFLGNKETQTRIGVLKALGVTNILVVGSELDIHYENDFIYKQIKIKDMFFEDIAQYFDECYDFIEGSTGNVYVHCAVGVSRSAAIVIAYLMRKEEKGLEQAFWMVKERRDRINPNGGFMKQLKKYEATLKK